jgi:D-alanyl-lipoteichoic acid acyltransferase DltB (MBOAT superfamily)
LIAIARLAGFRLLRNTCRPLSSRTIAEFWNRYYYYFKELLVDVYFYPTYVRWFKRHPRLRIAFATFMAAGVGNFFFHFVFQYHETIVLYGLSEALVRSQTYAFYCLLLVIGIVLSQLRARREDAGAGWLRGRAMPALGVSAFFCFLSFFDGPHRHEALRQHFRFLFHVFGIDRWIQGIG